MTRKVYVYNISSTTRQEELQSLFERFGPVESCILKKREAIITFEDYRDAGESKILNGYTLNHRELFISQTLQSKTLLVTNISRRTSKDDIIGVFARFGIIVSYRLEGDQAIIQFEKHNDAFNALSLDQREFDDNKISIFCAPSDDDKYKLFANNIPSSMRLEDIEIIFRVHGKITKIEHFGKYAYITYEYLKSAKCAIEELNSMKIKDLQMSVKYYCISDSESRDANKEKEIYKDTIKNSEGNVYSTITIYKEDIPADPNMKIYTYIKTINNSNTLKIQFVDRDNLTLQELLCSLIKAKHQQKNYETDTLKLRINNV
jgi:RNA recognition motif-containing protein